MPGWFRTSSVVATGREVAAFARQAVLLPHDVEPVIPAEARDGDDVVVLLHGLFASAGVLRPLRAAIAQHAGRRGMSGSGASAQPRQVHTATLSYAPGPGVEILAERLARVIASLPPRVHLHLVGHSLGGVVCRFFAQEARDPRVVQTISMASPFGGVPRVGLLGFAGARDLDRSSAILRRILLGTAHSSVPHLSIIAGADTVVRPPLAHALPGGEVRVMAACGHNTVLFDAEVATLIARRVVEWRERPAARGDGNGSDGDLAAQ